MKLSMRDVVKISEKTQNEIADELGITRQSLWVTLGRDMRLSSMQRVAEVIGYKVCLVKGEEIIELK